MKKFFLLMMFLVMHIGFAQQGINYKAIVKDGSGNVVTTPIVVQFIIYKGAALTNIVYQETNNTTPNANGLAILNIGTGTVVSGVFSDINWASDDHFLNVQIDTGTGLVDMGTTQFMAVPYALNVSGLEKITENGKLGWRLIGQDPANYGNIGISAIDLSVSYVFSSVNGATGDNSIAFGSDVSASGLFSTAIGYNGSAIGEKSMVLGANSIASGDYSMALGNSSYVSGSYAIAMGKNTRSDSYNSTTLGRYNVGGGAGLIWNATDPLFEIGNGTDAANTNNALTIYKNGNAKFDGRIQSTATGAANLVPIAYGSINGSSPASILGGTGNFTVFFNNTTNVYTISIAGQTLSASTTVASVVVNTSNFRSVNVTYSSGNMFVHIFLANGTKVASPFQFVVHQL